MSERLFFEVALPDEKGGHLASFDIAREAPLKGEKSFTPEIASAEGVAVLCAPSMDKNRADLSESSRYGPPLSDILGKLPDCSTAAWQNVNELPLGFDETGRRDRFIQ